MALFSNTRPDKQAVADATQDLADQPRGPVPAWSFSQLKKFEECPYRVYLSKVEKHPEPSSTAAERGTMLHDLAEDYIRGNSGEEVPRELEKLHMQYHELHDAYQANPEQFELEQDWGFTALWQPTGWFAPDIWARMKLDVFWREGSSAHIIDHKSGRKFGNELKHSDQGLQYAVGAFKRYPTLEYAKVSFYYFDKGEVMTKAFSRDRAMVFLPRIEQRAFALTNATQEQLTRPKPSKNNCKFCPHAETGACPWRVTS